LQVADATQRSAAAEAQAQEAQNCLKALTQKNAEKDEVLAKQAAEGAEKEGQSSQVVVDGLNLSENRHSIMNDPRGAG
jgi:regulator of protease activity HflC (stomatin/prohibitin superfamily)